MNGTAKPRIRMSASGYWIVCNHQEAADHPELGVACMWCVARWA
jgi:hypothetical protein